MNDGHVIKNLVQLVGTMEDVDKVVKELGSKKNALDFSKIVPIDKDIDDVDMDEYINACLNVYMQEKQVDPAKFNKTCTFVGHTREVPYEFRILTQSQLNSVKAQYQTKKMIKDAESFLNRIESKAIFNGYMIREVMWGTGSGAANVKIKGNQISFDTYDLPAITVIEKLAKKYSNVKFIYTYAVDNVVNRISFKGEYKKEEIKNAIPEVRTYGLITKRVTLH